MARDIWHYSRNDFAIQVLETLRSGPLSSIMLYGPRGSGKTAFLLTDVLPNAGAHGIRPVYASFMASFAAFPTLLTALDAALAEQRNKVTQSWLTVNAFKPVVTLSPPGMHDTLRLDLGAKERSPVDEVRLLELYLDALDDGRGKLTLCLDDFDDIDDGAEAARFHSALRSVLDRRQTQIASLFCGASMPRLNKVFNDRKAPFYRWALPMDLPELDDGFVRHQISVFETVFHRSLDFDTAYNAFRDLGRSPLAYRRWLAQVGLNPGLHPREALELTLEDIADANGFPDLWIDLSPLQRALARIIAERVGDLFGEEGADRVKALTGDDAPSPQNRQSAIRRLERLGLVENWERRRRIADGLFERWILDRPDEEFWTA